MPDYKKKKVRKFGKSPKSKHKNTGINSAENIEMSPKDKKVNVKPQSSNVRVIKGKKLERRHKFKIFAAILVFVTAVLTVLHFILPIGIMENYIAIKKSNDFENKLSAVLIEFVLKLKALPYYDKALSKTNEDISLFHYKEIEEYYGDVYSTKYTCSLSGLCELLLNRDITLKISISENEYFVPAIIADNKDPCELWMSDIMTLGNYPMATMVNVSDMGTLDTFISRVKDIKNSILVNENDVTIKEILNKYEHSLRIKIHPRVEELIKLQK